jgi:hypothetical protein
MGVYTSLRTSSGEVPRDAWFSKSFSNVRAAIPGEMNAPELPDAVWRAIEPLTRIFQPEDDHEDEESFWQDPDALLASVDAVLTILRSDPTPLEARRIVNEFYTKADFEHDLLELKSELESAMEQGIPGVQLWLV